jgi:hypothetical protein
MENADKPGFSIPGSRELTPAQWDDFMERANQRAHDARARAFRDAARGVGRLLRCLARGAARMVGRGWRAGASAAAPWRNWPRSTITCSGAGAMLRTRCGDSAAA